MTKWKEGDKCRWCPEAVFRRPVRSHKRHAKYWFTHTFECRGCGKTYMDSNTITHTYPGAIKNVDTLL